MIKAVIITSRITLLERSYILMDVANYNKMIAAGILPIWRSKNQPTI